MGLSESDLRIHSTGTGKGPGAAAVLLDRHVP